jgi:hypothetical protein
MNHLTIPLVITLLSGAADPSTLGLWANILTTRYQSNGWALPFGDLIIVSSFDSPAQPNLSSRSRPSFDGSTPSRYVAQSPLLLGPGGKNMFKASFETPTVPPGSPHTISKLERDGTGWFDRDTSSSPVYLNPQPPILNNASNSVFKIKTVQAPDNLIGQLYPSTADHIASIDQVGWAADPQLRQFRFHILNNSSSALANQTPPSTAMVSLGLRNDDITSNLATDSKARVSNQSRWIPHTLAYGEFPFSGSSGGPRILMRIVEASMASPSSDGYLYLACDLAKDGEGSLGYPQLPEQSGTDERLTITGFDLQGSFSLLMAGIMPDDDWNHLTPRFDHYWPLFTLWADPDNWIEFGAYATGHPAGSGTNITHIEDGRFRIRINAATTLTQFDWPRNDDGAIVEDLYWSRNSQLLAGLSYDIATNRLTVIASLGGEGARNGGPSAGLPIAVFGNGSNFDTLKFWGVSGSTEEVVAMRWFGGEAVAGAAMTVSGMADQFRTLAFLT